MPEAGLDPQFGPIAPRSARPEQQTVTLPRLTQVYLALVRDAPAVLDADYPAFLVVNHVLGGHFFSRLSVALRHEGGETYGASATWTSDLEPGSLALTTFTRTENAKATEAKLRAVLAALHRGGISEQERATAVGYLVGRRPFSRQSPGQIMARRLAELRRGLPAGFYDDLVDRSAALTLDEVNMFIKRYYDPAEFSLVRVVPE